jgi:co-chaperonin GroES (HSP10)
MQTIIVPDIKPTGAIVVLNVTPQDKTSAAGIYLPVAVQGAETRMEATIVATGPDCKRTDIQVGARVYVGKFCSNEIPRDGLSYKLAQETDIFAILDANTHTPSQAADA